MNKLLNMMLLLTALGVFPATIFAAVTTSYDDQAPDKDYIWVDGYLDAQGEQVKGFYRVRSRQGFAWVDGDYDERGDWIEPHWSPIDKNPGYVWAPGHVGADSYWVYGHWRVVALQGYTWAEPVSSGGVRAHGYWQPIIVKPGYIWLPGHHGSLGHWRPVNYAGHHWVNGHWRYGAWAPGIWRPHKARAGHLWVGGHWRKNGWVVGYWRPEIRHGYNWRVGYWGAGGWVVGGWQRGPRVVVKRRYTRIHTVERMQVKRASHNRPIKHPKKFVKSKGHKKLSHPVKTGKHTAKRGKKVRKNGQYKKKKGKKKKKKKKARRG